jgi:RNA polymerase sigma-70 factor (ECF subfamily)
MDGEIAQRYPGWGPDPLLIERFVTDAFETYGQEVTAHLGALVHDRLEAEDLNQEAFLRLHAQASAGRPPENVRAWLHRVAVNLAMSRGRHLQVQSRVAPRLRVDDDASATDELVVRREDERRLRAALADMAPTDREALLLAAAGYSGPEIAAELGRSQVATRTLLCRARGRLRIRLAAAEGPAAC